MKKNIFFKLVQKRIVSNLLSRHLPHGNVDIVSMKGFINVTLVNNMWTICDSLSPHDVTIQKGYACWGTLQSSSNNKISNERKSRIFFFRLENWSFRGIKRFRSITMTLCSHLVKLFLQRKLVEFSLRTQSPFHRRFSE
jgi:hypothetical protein